GEIAGNGEHLVEEGIVEVVPIRQYHHGRICHFGVTHDQGRIQLHFEALPRPLRMPYDPSPSVASYRRRHHRRLDRGPYCPVLVVLRDLLDQSGGLIHESYEVPDVL